MNELLERVLPIFFEQAPFAASFAKLPRGELLVVNNEFVRVFGFSKEEVIGKTSLELGINPDIEKREEIISRLRLERRIRDIEIPLHLKTGELRYFSLNIDVLDIDGDSYILQTARDITSRVSMEQDRTNEMIRLEKAYDFTIQGWASALELRDIETKGHSVRVARAVVDLAKHMGIKNGQLSHLWRGGILHDIGKMGIPDSILLKPDRLTKEEMDIMKTHPRIAFDMLKHIGFLRPALYIPYCHHEKWDGTGYPQGLRGESIPRYARMFSVVDTYDALIHPRPYKAAWEKERALTHIQLEKNISFDPDIVDQFIDMMKG